MKHSNRGMRRDIQESLLPLKISRDTCYFLTSNENSKDWHKKMLLMSPFNFLYSSKLPWAKTILSPMAHIAVWVRKNSILLYSTATRLKLKWLWASSFSEKWLVCNRFNRNIYGWKEKRLLLLNESKIPQKSTLSASNFLSCIVSFLFALVIHPIWLAFFRKHIWCSYLKWESQDHVT